MGLANKMPPQRKEGCRAYSFEREDKGVYNKVNDCSPNHEKKGARCALFFGLAETVGFEPTVPGGTTDFEGRETAKTPYISAQVFITSPLKTAYIKQFSYKSIFSQFIFIHVVF